MLTPEDFEEVTIQTLPEPWKSALLCQEIGLLDIPEDVFRESMLEGLRRYYKQKEYACVTEMTGL